MDTASRVPTGNPARGRDMACHVRRPTLNTWCGGLLALQRAKQNKLFWLFANFSTNDLALQVDDHGIRAE